MKSLISAGSISRQNGVAEGERAHGASGCFAQALFKFSPRLGSPGMNRAVPCQVMPALSHNPLRSAFNEHDERIAKANQACHALALGAEMRPGKHLVLQPKPAVVHAGLVKPQEQRSLRGVSHREKLAFLLLQVCRRVYRCVEDEPIERLHGHVERTNLE